MVLSNNKEIHITDSQKETISDWIKNKEPFIEIFDIDSWDCLFSWKTILIKEFRKKTTNYSHRKYVCMYGVRHHPNEECNCIKKFWISHYKFYNRLTSRNYKFEYPSEIQQKWINEFLYNNQKPNYEHP